MNESDITVLNELAELCIKSLKNLLDKIWLIGNDLGDLVFFYGEGKDGFGLYREEMGSLVSVDGADKIADTLTDFLVNGTGIDVAISL